ncbi:unnamed protein product, partial [Polarella glacialis]
LAKTSSGSTNSNKNKNNNNNKNNKNNNNNNNNSTMAWVVADPLRPFHKGQLPAGGCDLAREASFVLRRRLPLSQRRGLPRRVPNVIPPGLHQPRRPTGPRGSNVYSTDFVLSSLLALGGPDAPREEDVGRILHPALHHWRCRPQAATLVLGGLAKGKATRALGHVLKIMQNNSVDVNEFHCNTALHAFKLCGKWQLALGTLGNMPNMRATPNDVSYCTAYCAGEKHGTWQLVLGMLKVMPKVNLMPSLQSCSGVASVCSKQSQWQISVQLILRMPCRRLVPDTCCSSCYV